MKGYKPTNVKFETANTSKNSLSLELGMIEECKEDCTKSNCKCKKKL